MRGYIYTITNKINGKCYVGKTTENPDKYWNLHKNRASNGWIKVLYHSMRKHGSDSFDFKVIIEIESDTVEQLNIDLNKLEIETIATLNTLIPNGYNVTIGGDGTKGVKRDEAFKENLRKIKTGVPRPEWVKQKFRVPKSEEHKEKLRKPKTEKHKQKLRDIWETFSDEKKNKIFQKGLQKRRNYSGESNPFYGKQHSVEFLEWITKHNTEYQNREEIKLNNKLKQPHRISVNMVDPLSNEIVKTFIGLRDAKRWVAANTKYKGDVSTISKAVENGKVSYGFKWIKNDD